MVVRLLTARVPCLPDIPDEWTRSSDLSAIVSR